MIVLIQNDMVLHHCSAILVQFIRLKFVTFCYFTFIILFLLFQWFQGQVGKKVFYQLLLNTTKPSLKCCLYVFIQLEKWRSLQNYFKDKLYNIDLFSFIYTIVKFNYLIYIIFMSVSVALPSVFPVYWPLIR